MRAARIDFARVAGSTIVAAMMSNPQPRKVRLVKKERATSAIARTILVAQARADQETTGSPRRSATALSRLDGGVGEDTEVLFLLMHDRRVDLDEALPERGAQISGNSIRRMPVGYARL